MHAAEKGYKVTIFTSRKDEFSKTLQIINKHGSIIHKGDILLATDDYVQAFTDADLIFVTLPSFCMKNFANKIEGLVKPNAKIALIPGGGGGECAFKNCIEKGCTVFGLQRVPSVARLIKYGETVRAVGYRDKLFAAAIPNNQTEECCCLLANILDMVCLPLPNYLNVALTPSNPILHTTRLRVLFKDYNKDVPYTRIPYFYEDWDNESSELLLRCDAEVQEICQALKEFDVSYVKSLKEHYESSTPDSLTAKIRGIEGFKGIQTPMIKVVGGWQPDFNSRYFTADFSYGLKMLLDVARLLGICAPNMQETLDWYIAVTGIQAGFSFQDYEILDKKNFNEFYSL